MAREITGIGKRRSVSAEAGWGTVRASLRPTLGRVRRLTAGLSHHRAPVWSVDGRHLAFLLGQGDDASWVVIDRKGRLSRVIAGPADGGASFAPDGSLAYGRAVGATSEIWLLPALATSSKGPTGARRLLGGDGRLYRHPAFSPDGRYLAYVADDGMPGTARRLWRLDLQSDEHSLLVAALPGPDSPSRLACPIWSPGGEGLYFEAQSPDGSAVYFLPAAAPATPLRLSAGGYRHPAPLAPGAVLCERSLADGSSELCILLHPPPSASWSIGQVQELPLRPGKRKRDSQECLRDPAIGYGKRGPWLAFAATTRRDESEPARCELFAARLQGLRALPGRAKPFERESDNAIHAEPPDVPHTDADPREGEISGTASESSAGGERP